jgi:hypothetical protein
MADYRTSDWDGFIRERSTENRTSHRKQTRDYLGYTTPAFEDDVRVVYDELMSLLLKKHKDYGPKNIADAPGGAINGLRIRMHDKLARINNLYDNSLNASPENEPLEDSFKDLANYAIIGLLVLRGKWDN